MIYDISAICTALKQLVKTDHLRVTRREADGKIDDLYVTAEGAGILRKLQMPVTLVGERDYPARLRSYDIDTHHFEVNFRAVVEEWDRHFPDQAERARQIMHALHGVHQLDSFDGNAVLPVLKNLFEAGHLRVTPAKGGLPHSIYISKPAILPLHDLGIHTAPAGIVVQLTDRDYNLGPRQSWVPLSNIESKMESPAEKAELTAFLKSAQLPKTTQKQTGRH